MKTVLHKKTDWFNGVELVGNILQVVIGLSVMLVLAIMASKVGVIWKLLF